MKISYVEVQNYRKLKCCHISFTDKETLFVGANNSGKTSAMDAMIYFLDPKSKSNVSGIEGGASSKQKLSTLDFTLSNWNHINAFAETWLNSADRVGDMLSEWQPLCPSLDIWLDVEADEVHRVSHLIPTLKWDGGLLGVRLIFQPKNIEFLQSVYLTEYKAVEKLLVKAKEIKTKEGLEATDLSKLTLWPTSLRDFLDRELNKFFEVKAYILDPSKAVAEPGQHVTPQLISEGQEPLTSYPFHQLFKVDIIDAQRGFSDPNSLHNNTNKQLGNLSGQLNQYYTRHLNPSDLPDEDDLDALCSIGEAKSSFDTRLNTAFEKALGEIKDLGYPGFNDPEIRLSSKVEPLDSLDHEAAIQFDIHRQEPEDGSLLLSLPEKYNGLGYKNLIAIVFRLISFRDQWMRVGKAGKRRADEDASIEPLHLVLIEEPEVHLHAQVQQVFIRKAYEVLRNHSELKKEDSKYTSQMVVSSHSSYLAHEVGFENLRYFKRVTAKTVQEVPSVEVVDLSKTFGDPNKRGEEVKQTVKFVARYLRTTHCDLFFANGIILVEGAAERMLLPHFISIRNDNEKGLNRSYISILEVGGAHAHRLKPLIDKLALPTLIITDTDAVNIDGKKCRPQRNVGCKSSSDTLKGWFGLKDKSLDEVLDIPYGEKVKGHVRAAYQYGIKVKFNGADEEAIPYTFEDALALTNIDLFKKLDSATGMAKKMKEALSKDSLDTCCDELFKALEKDKAKMALDLLDVDPQNLQVPEYIEEGLDWLEMELEKVSKDYSEPKANSNDEISSYE